MKNLKFAAFLNTGILLIFLVFSIAAEGQNKNDLAVYNNAQEMVAAAKEVITEISVEEFKNTYTRDDIYIVDVRTSDEHSSGAVPGAVNIPRGVLEFRIGLDETWEKAGKNPPSKTDPVFVYCSTGGRGALSAKALMQLGYENVKSVEGGWNAWHETYPEIKQ